MLVLQLRRLLYGLVTQLDVLPLLDQLLQPILALELFAQVVPHCCDPHHHQRLGPTAALRISFRLLEAGLNLACASVDMDECFAARRGPIGHREIVEVVVELSWFVPALGLDVDDERGAFSNFALCSHRPAHLLDDVLAYRQSKACSLTVSRIILIKLTEIDEQLLDTFLGDAHTIVNNAYLQVDVVLLLAAVDLVEKEVFARAGLRLFVIT